MKFYATYFGCRCNQAEIQEWIVSLENMGYQLTQRLPEADFGILNTCCVTEKAEREVIHFIQRMYRHRLLPWFVVGCAVTRVKSFFSERYKNYFFFDNDEKPRLVETIAELFPPPDNLIYHSSFKSRFFLKVQDGCNFRCSFCIVPALRGKSRSLPFEQVMARGRYYALLGYREIVLTGINLSSYGYDLFPRQTLLGLIQELARLRQVEVIRLSSLDPRFIKFQVIRELSFCLKIADSFHFSLQSGSDSVLNRMKRGGKSLEYKKILSTFRKFFPDANLGADILVGFPGETEREFKETLDFVSESTLNYIHIFPFSPRPNTKAAMLEPVSQEVVRRRVGELKEVNLHKRLEFRERFRDRTLEGILIEENPEYSILITRNYLSLRIPPLQGFKKRKIRVRMTRVLNANLCEGEIVRK